MSQVRDRREPHVQKFAKQLRRDMTLAELILWRELRRGALGVRFRRQDPIGPWIADFVAHKRRLIVEVDGTSHTDPDRDRRRDLWFLERGYSVLHLANEEVLNDLDGALHLIDLALEDPRLVPDLANTSFILFP